MPIRVLPETVAAQIAAGEVVERPASVVKELLENALDAGATTVSVEVREGGRRLVRVADDGCGIPAGEVALAFHRYSTSKLTSATDLEAILTLGFRGEALASIASVAQVTLVTRVQGETAGSQLRVEGGQITSQESVGAPQGTMVGVENLFFNVPARRKFLRSVGTEKRHITALVTRYAMAYPAVRLRLTHDGRMAFRSPGTGKLKDALMEVYGLETVRQMLAVGEPESQEAAPSGALRVRGYTGAPGLSRANRSQITIFVNGRWVQDRGLTYAVIQAYYTLLMTGRYPVSVILLDLPPSEVDVNVHPTKAEIRLRDREAAFGAVQRAVRRALVDSAPLQTAAAVGVWTAGGGWTAAGADAPAAASTPGAGGEPGLHTALASLQHGPRFQPELELPGGTAGQRPAGALESPDSQGRLPILRIVGQIGAAYIVAEGPGELVLVDQHAAHERVLYEQYLDQREKGVPTQGLLQAMPVELSPDRAGLLEEHLPVLAELGFQVEHFGGATFVVRGLPALLGEINPSAALEAVTDDLEVGKQPLEGTIEERMIARVCKTAAVKAGQVLTLQEMSALVRELEACESPHTCPHGRPTMIRMPAEELAKQFERT